MKILFLYHCQILHGFHFQDNTFITQAFTYTQQARIWKKTLDNTMRKQGGVKYCLEKSAEVKSTLIILHVTTTKFIYTICTFRKTGNVQIAHVKLTTI